MERIKLMVQTISAGAAAQGAVGGEPTLAAAYAACKRHLAQRYGTVDLARIEARPDSVRGREYLAEDLADAGAGEDAALLAAVARLLAALHQSTEAQQTARKIGVDIAQVRAQALKLSDIWGEDVAVLLRESEFAEAVAIRGARGGAAGPAGAMVNVLVGNQAGQIILGGEAGTDFGALEQHYLQGLYSECNEVALANDGPVDAVRLRQPRLQHIYVDLATTRGPNLAQAVARLPLTPVERQNLWAAWNALQARLDRAAAQLLGRPVESVNAGIPGEELQKLEERFGLTKGSLGTALAQKLTVLEVLGAETQLVLLGEPGGGKSTLTRRLAGVLASRAVARRDEAEEQWLTAMTGVWGRWLLPLRVVMSRWAQKLAPDTQGVADDLLAEGVRLLGQTAEVRGLKEHLMGRLTAEPPSVLILLDGLDEVADGEQRARLQRAVRHFGERYPRVPLVITCRSRPWAAWQAAGEALTLPVYTLDRLTPVAIADFLARWHAELVRAGRYEAAAAQTAQTRLQRALADGPRRELGEMAGTPLLLTMMARVNYEHGLPESRAELYEAYLRQLLWEWERAKLDERGQLTGLQRLLAQANPPIPANNLELALGRLAFEVHASQGSRDTVDIPESALRTALEAIHPSAKRSERAAWAVEALELIHERSGLLKSLDGQNWQFAHRTFQEYLAARHLATGDTATVLGQMREKVDQEGWREALLLALGYQIAVQSQYDAALAILDELLPEAAQNEGEWRRVLLLGEAYVRLLGPGRARLAQQRKRAERLMGQIPKQLTAAMQERTLAAAQRLAAGRLLAELGEEPARQDEFVGASGWAFRMARYPVTNAQYGRFMAAGGYATRKWWSQVGWRYKNGEPAWTAPRYWDDEQFNWPTQPVVGVSWYEANAYCAWLTAELRGRGEISRQAVVRLPTQAEWEQAARSMDGRAYPWGSDFDVSRANTGESGLGQTTPVDMYPTGATPEGMWDLGGNVWEWTNDVDKDDWPWLKGGSWYDNGDRASSAARLDVDPVSGNHVLWVSVCGRPQLSLIVLVAGF